MKTSRTIDTAGHLWVEQGDQKEGPIVEVAPIIPVWKTFAYAVPPDLNEVLRVGQRVMVPVGRTGRLVKGFVVRRGSRVWDSTLRPVDSVLEKDSYLTPELIELGRQIAEHYMCPLGRTLKSITPEAVRRERGLKTVRYARLVDTCGDMQDQMEHWSKKRQHVVEILHDTDNPIRVDELLSRAECSPGLLRELVKSGVVEIEKRKEIVEETAFPPVLQEPDYALNAEQLNAIEHIGNAIDQAKFAVKLLYGVSGSGKTEVYIHAIRRVLDRGMQAILLVPEIVLTTQLVQRLNTRLPDLAVSHSGLTESQRSLMWRRTEAGEYKVIVGTRSAVFAPCPRLGLICIDEEQETSYKNLQAPRFHVRDVALMRAKQHDIPVVLGSATPSLEMWHHSEHRSDYQRIQLSKRVKNLPMPDVTLVDMRIEQLERKGPVVLSRIMERLLNETLDRGEQALLLINRRGFANRIYCPSCMTRITCPNCQVGMVMHRATGRSSCHYCHAQIPTPQKCPNVSCGQPLLHLGTGTQRVEDVLVDLFPNKRIMRVDSDTMRHRDQYRAIVQDFESRRIDVLVGTQMIAKGLDFPFVSLVGVIHADMDAGLGGFRASERLFQLMTQVAGRAGRSDVHGRVVVQTTMPELPALQWALTHDYESFVAEELHIRRQTLMPPFSRLARMVVEHLRSNQAATVADALANAIREIMDDGGLKGANVLGPNPCMIARMRGRYRFEIIVRTNGVTSLREVLRQARQAGVLNIRGATLTVDVDPVSLM